MLVATPGRVATLLEAGVLNLEDCRAVVLDEVGEGEGVLRASVCGVQSNRWDFRSCRAGFWALCAVFVNLGYTLQPRVVGVYRICWSPGAA